MSPEERERIVEDVMRRRRAGERVPPGEIRRREEELRRGKAADIVLRGKFWDTALSDYWRTLVFDDGFSMTFQRYDPFMAHRLEEMGLLWEKERTVARKRLKEADRALVRLILLLAGGPVEFRRVCAWEAGVWVKGEVPCIVRCVETRTVDGRVEGVLELSLKAATRPDAHELATEAFKRLYGLLTNRLEVKVEWLEDDRVEEVEVFVY
ncbi:hypothetical protein DRO33_02580 [Candidatus Bathyarchaeota archaeon]|nr:MAG: hypothetical protein DRO33_02580 [Candidatus Bathyarchaeota archaeon]